MTIRKGSLSCMFTCFCLLLFSSASGAENPWLTPLVPPQDIDEARALKNPYPMSQEIIEAGRKIYEGKAYCAACHGKDGRGLGKAIDPAASEYPLPRDFTDVQWQQARTDGELFWVLMHGSHGTDMAPFFPLYLSEMETWQVVAYIRTFWEKGREM